MNKIIGAVAVVAGIALILGLYAATHLMPSSSNGPSFGAAGGMLAENYIPYIMYNGGYNTAKSIKTTGDFTLGSSGTTQSNQVSTTCSMTANVSITATSTGYAFCTGVTGVTSADNVQAIFASSTGALINLDSWMIVGAKASSTAGAIDFQIMNLSGASRAPSALSQIGSTTSLWISH